MLSFIYGRTGTGKSAELFSRAQSAAASGKHVYILVPDRDAVIAERRASELSAAFQTIFSAHSAEYAKITSARARKRQ